MGLILSIDAGTTNLKAGVVDEKGEILAMRRVQVPVVRSERGAAEHDPRALYELMISICREICKDYRDRVTHLAISTYQLGLIFLDRHFVPLTGITLLSDTRARETIEEFRQSLDTTALYRRTGSPPMFQCPLARLFYFKTKKPELLAKTRYFLSCKDYLLYQLTGELVTEPSIAAATQMFNVNTFDWDDEALSCIGITKDQLARPVDGMKTLLPVLDSVRRELGLTTPQISIIPSVYDGGALAIGLGGLKRGVAVMNLGTSAMVRTPGPEPIFDDPKMSLQPYCLNKEVFLNGGALNNATLPLNWMREKLFEPDFNLAPARDGAPLFCLPYLTGERDNLLGPFASGVFFGLRDYHDRQDMLRSIMEGVAYSLCTIKESLCQGKNNIIELRAGGGGSASRIWMQMFADIFDARIKLPQAEEVALLGNAMVAYTATGVFGSLEQAADKMVSSGDSIDPIPANVERHKQYYGFFKELRTKLADVYREHAKLS